MDKILQEAFNTIFNKCDNLEKELTYLEDLINIIERIVNSGEKKENKDAQIFREESKFKYFEVLESIDHITKYHDEIKCKIEILQNYITSKDVQKMFRI
ncbi:MAG: hypothetical protein ACPK7O_01200 [Methanobacterium sp.]